MGEGVGTKTELDQKKTLSDETENLEKLDIVHGEEVEGEESGENANLFRHVNEEREDDRSAVDKAKDEEIKEQVLPENWDMERDEKEKEEKEVEPVSEEQKTEKDKKTEKTRKNEDKEALVEESDVTEVQWTRP